MYNFVPAFPDVYFSILLDAYNVGKEYNGSGFCGNDMVSQENYVVQLYQCMGCCQFCKIWEKFHPSFCGMRDLLPLLQRSVCICIRKDGVSI